MDTFQARQEITAKIRQMVAVNLQRSPISDDTEIFYDLRISGQDFYDLLVWISDKYRVVFKINVNDYSPREGRDPFLFREFRLRKRPYRSLTVGDLMKAIQHGEWPPSASDALGK